MARSLSHVPWYTSHLEDEGLEDLPDSWFSPCKGGSSAGPAVKASASSGWRFNPQPAPLLGSSFMTPAPYIVGPMQEGDQGVAGIYLIPKELMRPLAPACTRPLMTIGSEVQIMNHPEFEHISGRGAEHLRFGKICMQARWLPVKEHGVPSTPHQSLMQSVPSATQSLGVADWASRDDAAKDEEAAPAGQPAQVDSHAVAFVGNHSSNSVLGSTLHQGADDSALGERSAWLRLQAECEKRYSTLACPEPAQVQTHAAATVDSNTSGSPVSAHCDSGATNPGAEDSASEVSSQAAGSVSGTFDMLTTPAIPELAEVDSHAVAAVDILHSRDSLTSSAVRGGAADSAMADSAFTVSSQAGSHTLDTAPAQPDQPENLTAAAVDHHSSGSLLSTTLHLGDFAKLKSPEKDFQERSSSRLVFNIVADASWRSAPSVQVVPAMVSSHSLLPACGSPSAMCPVSASAVSNVVTPQPAASPEADLHHSASTAGAAEQASAEVTGQPALEQAGSRAEDQEAAQQQLPHEPAQTAAAGSPEADPKPSCMLMHLFRQAYIVAGHVAGAAAAAFAVARAITSCIF